MCTLFTLHCTATVPTEYGLDVLQGEGVIGFGDLLPLHGIVNLQLLELLDHPAYLTICKPLVLALFDGIDRHIGTVLRPHHSHSAAAYSSQNFPWTICRSVGLHIRASVGLSSAL